MKQHRSRRRWTWLGVLFVVFAGVLGMHGLGGHGLALDASDHPASWVAAGLVHAGSTPARGMVQVTAGTVTAMADRPPEEPGADDVAVGAMGGLCLAVLLAGAVAWALLTHTRPRPATLVRLPGAPASMATCGRDRDPPTLTMLCLRRC